MTDVIVFLVDASNRDRFEESYEALAGILKNDELAHVPVVVLGNKIDRYEISPLSRFRAFFLFCQWPVVALMRSSSGRYLLS